MDAPIGEGRSTGDDSDHDSLTGLLSGIALWDRIDDFLGRTRAGSDSCAFWLIDLDGFVWINSELGHAIGDALLQAVVRNLNALTGAEDLLARAGSDEFMFFRHHVDGRDEVVAVAEQLRSAIDQPFILPEHAGGPGRVHARITASIGAALGGTDLTANDLCARADWAIYEVKSSGGNGVAFFGDLMERTIATDSPDATSLPRASWKLASALDLPVPLDIGTPRCTAIALDDSVQAPPRAPGVRRTVRCHRVDGHPSPHIGGFRNIDRINSCVLGWSDVR